MEPDDVVDQLLNASSIPGHQGRDHTLLAADVIDEKRRRTKLEIQASRNLAQEGSEISQTPQSPRDRALPTRQGDSVERETVRAVLVDESFHAQYAAGGPSASDRSIATECGARLPADNIAANHGSDNTGALAAALDAESVLPEDSSLSYIGDKRGAGSFVYDLCYPSDPQEARHYLLPRISKTSRRPFELDYMHQIGAFTLFPDDVCDHLVRCYFQHVHFFLPVVDASSFLNEYVQNKCKNLNLLLIWSMFLAAGNFVDAEILQKAGYLSRKDLKRVVYERAKCLYDFDHETDKLQLIQSVILMGFWYTDTQDRTGAWYWIGIAVSLAQSLGLHRSPRLTSQCQKLPEPRQSQIRRIWWTCLVRDRWLSLVKGRPMRIHHEDCDQLMPTSDDILNELTRISPEAREKYIPDGSELLTEMWIGLVRISAVLGNILRVHYRANGQRAGVEDIDKCAEDLRSCAPVQLAVESLDDRLRLQAYQLQLFYEATVVVLYRPYVLKGPASLPLEAQALWQKEAQDRARAAAANTNIILEKVIYLNAVQFLRPMIITTLIPAMQIHLFDCKSMLPLTRGLGKNKLSLCMLVLSELRETYWGADVMHRLFERAQSILANQKPAVSHSASNLGVPISKQNFQPSNGHVQLLAEVPLSQQLQQGQENFLLSDPAALMDEQAMPAWTSDAMYFSTVDQLLSPGFSLTEDAYAYLFGDSENNMMGSYDEIGDTVNDVSTNLLFTN